MTRAPPPLWPPDARDNSLEKTLMLGKIEGRRRKGQQRMRWLDDYEVPFHASQNGCDPKVYKQEMLERVWRKGNPLTL